MFHILVVYLIALHQFINNKRCFDDTTLTENNVSKYFFTLKTLHDCYYMSCEVFKKNKYKRH